MRMLLTVLAVLLTTCGPGLKVGDVHYYVYVGDDGGDVIHILSVDAESGDLEMIGTEPLPDARDFVVHPNGKFLFVVTGPTPNSVASFAINSDGTLKFRNSLPIASATNTLGVSPDGRFVYVTLDTPGETHKFGLKADGTLTDEGSIGGLSMQWGGVRPGGEHFIEPVQYLMDNTANLHWRHLSGPGLQGTQSIAFFQATSTGPWFPAFSPFGDYLYVGNGTFNLLEVARLEHDGNPVKTDVLSISIPEGLAMHPNGKFLYLLTTGAVADIFHVNPVTGTPTFYETYSYPGTDFDAVDFVGTGKMVALLAGATSRVASLRINADGTLEKLSESAVIAGLSNTFPHRAFAVVAYQERKDIEQTENY